MLCLFLGHLCAARQPRSTTHLFASSVPLLPTPVPQVVTQYGDHDVPHVLEACERMEAHLTAAIVSNDIRFVQHILGSTVNGTTYAGMRARTTGGAGLGGAG